MIISLHWHTHTHTVSLKAILNAELNRWRHDWEPQLNYNTSVCVERNREMKIFSFQTNMLMCFLWKTFLKNSSQCSKRCKTPQKQHKTGPYDLCTPSLSFEAVWNGILVYYVLIYCIVPTVVNISNSTILQLYVLLSHDLLTLDMTGIQLVTKLLI